MFLNVSYEVDTDRTSNESCGIQNKRTLPWPSNASCSCTNLALLYVVYRIEKEDGWLANDGADGRPPTAVCWVSSRGRSLWPVAGAAVLRGGGREVRTAGRRKELLGRRFVAAAVVILNCKSPTIRRSARPQACTRHREKGDGGCGGRVAGAAQAPTVLWMDAI